MVSGPLSMVRRTGTGFHPELTGRENMTLAERPNSYLNGAIPSSSSGQALA